MGVIGDVTSLAGDVSGTIENSTSWQVYDMLVSYDDKLQVQPELAESWDLSSDSTELRFSLRKGVQYHSGREFTSDDVKYSLQRAATTGKFPAVAAWFTITNPDKYTVVLKSDKPRPGVFDFLTYINMLDKDTVDVKTKSIGTGPFVLVEYAQGDHMTLARNKNYWRSGQPYLDGINMQVTRDQQALAVQLEAGAIDLADNPSVVDAQRLKPDSKWQLVSNDRGQFWYVVCNTTWKPLDNKQVRQALNYAIDRKRFTETVLQGTNGPQDLPWPSFSPAYEQAKNGSYSFDLDKAKSMLAGAGIKTLDMDLNFKVRDLIAAFAPIYQADLAKIGINATLKPTDAATGSSNLQKVNYNGVTLALLAKAHLAEPATDILGISGLNPEGNTAGLKDPNYTKLVEAATTEPDATKRKAIYSQINDALLDLSFTMPLSLSSPLGVATSKIQGLRWDMIPRYALREAWMG